MQIKIPFNKRELNADGNIVDNKGDITANLDMSVNAEARWETHFPNLAEKETIFNYVDRLQNAKRTDTNTAAVVLSSIKAVYCFLTSESLPTFESFAALFDLSDSETIAKQIKALELAFGVVRNGAAATSKN